MESKDLKTTLSRAQVTKLKALGAGIKVGKVMGRRVLVKLVIPHTAMDEVEKKGVLFIPETVKEANTPLPSTGVVVQIGQELKNDDYTPKDSMVQEGDMVMFSRFAGTDFIVEQEDYRMLEEQEIMCTLVPADEEESLGSLVAPIMADKETL